MSVEVIAIITPKPGNEERVREGLSQLAGHVQDNESGATRYQLYEQTNGQGTNDFVVVEEYKSSADHDSHNTSDLFKSLVAQIQSEDLLGAPLQIKTVKKVAGFLSR